MTREVLWVGGGQAMAMIGTLVGVRVLTGLLPPDEFGQLALAMTAAILVNQSIFGPLTGSAARFYAPAVEEDALGAYLNSIKRLATYATGLTFLMLLVATAVIQFQDHTQWLALTSSAFAFALFSGYSTVLSGMQNAARQRSIVAAHQAGAAWARFVVAAALLMTFGLSSSIAMFGFALATLLTVCSQGYIFLRGVRVGGSRADVSQVGNRRWQTGIVQYTWPFAVWGVFTCIQQASDRWALGILAGAQDVGLYAALYQVGYRPVMVLTNAFLELLSPILFARAGNASDMSRLREVSIITRRLSGIALCLTAGGVCVAWFLDSVIFRVLVAPEYRSISYLLPWAVLGGGLFAAGQIASVQYLSHFESAKLILPKIATASLGILLNLAGAYLFGLDGVVGALVLFSAVYFLWIFLGTTFGYRTEGYR